MGRRRRGNKRTKLKAERRNWKVFLQKKRRRAGQRQKDGEQWWRATKYIYSSVVLGHNIVGFIPLLIAKNHFAGKRLFYKTHDQVSIRD